MLCGRREGVMLKLMPLCHDCALTSDWQATWLSGLVFRRTKKKRTSSDDRSEGRGRRLRPLPFVARVSWSAELANGMMPTTALAISATRRSSPDSPPTQACFVLTLAVPTHFLAILYARHRTSIRGISRFIGLGVVDANALCLNGNACCYS